MFQIDRLPQNMLTDGFCTKPILASIFIILNHLDAFRRVQTSVQNLTKLFFVRQANILKRRNGNFGVLLILVGDV